MLETLSRHLDVEFLNIGENDFQIVDTSLAGVLQKALCQRLGVLPLFFLQDDGEKLLTLADAHRRGFTASRFYFAFKNSFNCIPQ